MKTALVTGFCGLIGSEVTAYFARPSGRVTGVDNNLRPSLIVYDAAQPSYDRAAIFPSSI